MNKTPRKTSLRNNWLKPLVIIVAVLATLYLLLIFLVMPLYTRQWQQIEVPDVRNLSFSAAEKILQHQKLEPVQGEVKYDDSLPAGFVIFQSPTPSMVVKKRRRIYLTVSKGKRPVTVPNLVGMAERDARFTLVQSELDLREIEYEFDRYYPEGVVSEQSIEPESEVEAGSFVDLIVSLGEEPEQIFVPYLIGKPQKEAEFLIKKSLLTLGDIGYRETSEVASDIVIFQSLEAGLKAEKGDTLNIILSKLPPGMREVLPW